MVLVACPCGNDVTLQSLPARPFIQCPRCSRRLPVHCDPADFMERCPKCGRFLEKDAIPVHMAVCDGVPEPLPD